MDFVAAAGSGNARRISVYPGSTSGYCIVISTPADGRSEPDVTVRQIQSETEVLRLLEREGVARAEICRKLHDPAAGLATMIAVLAGFLPIALLTAMALVPFLSPF